MRTHQNLSMFSSTKYFLDDVRQFVELEVTPQADKFDSHDTFFRANPPCSSVTRSCAGESLDVDAGFLLDSFQLLDAVL